MSPAASKPAAPPEPDTGGFDLDREGGEGWRPNPGDILTGTVLSINNRWSDWTNAFYPVLTIQPDGGGDPKSIHAFHAALFRRVLTLRPQEGERIGIKYHGEVENSDGKTKSKIYTLKVDRAPGSGHDPYAGLRSPGGKEAKEAVKASNEVSDDDIPF